MCLIVGVGLPFLVVSSLASLKNIFIYMSPETWEQDYLFELKGVLIDLASQLGPKDYRHANPPTDWCLSTFTNKSQFKTVIFWVSYLYVSTIGDPDSESLIFTTLNIQSPDNASQVGLRYKSGELNIYTCKPCPWHTPIAFAP